MASVKLLLQYGNAEQKEMTLNEIMKNFKTIHEGSVDVVLCE